MTNPVSTSAVRDTQAAAGVGQPSGGAEAAAKQTDLTKDAFLQLLVAQIKNQDPLNPTDGVQFLTQLAQFSQLEQTIAMRTDLQGITEAIKTQPEASNQTN